MPTIQWGRRTRTILDVGCGVASFGGYLLDRNVITMSFAPKDEHEAQIQFAPKQYSPASLPGAARAEPHRPRRSPSLTAPPASPPLERATGCPRGRKDGGGGAFFPFPPSSPALFPLQWCCCERRGPIRRWLAWPFLWQRGRISMLVGRIRSPVARSGGYRARLPTSSGGWDAVVVWSAVGAAWVLSSCPLPCSGCAWAGRRRWQGKARWCGGRASVHPDVQRCDVALAVGTVRAEAVVGHRRRGCGGGGGVASSATPWWCGQSWLG